MARTALFCLAAVLLCLIAVNGAPQFGGFSQSNAQAGAFGGGFGGGYGGYPQGPGFGLHRPPGYGYPGGYRPGFNRGNGGSISISKSISISRGAGGGGGAQSSASSNAGSFGK